MIVDLKSISDDMGRFYRHGSGKVFYAGFNALAPYYNIKEGGVTDWTGYPGSGKTELLLDLLKNQSEWHSHKHLVHMPDAGTNVEVCAKLIHKISGKPFEEFYYDEKGQKVMIENRISEAEMLRHLPDVIEHFKIFDTKGNRSKSITPKEFWDYAAENKKKLGIFSAVIDSWNYMNHDTQGYEREDKWLEHTLSYRNEVAERNNLHFHTIIHPRGAKKDKNGKIIMPDMHHLKGGSEWANNGKTIVIVHRDFQSKITDIKIDKAKPKIVGIQGVTCLNYDVNKGTFFENIDGKKHYAHKDSIVSQPELAVAQNVDHPDSYVEPVDDDQLF